MRITTQMMYLQFNEDLQTTMASIFKTNEQISTGKKLNRPSDDPAAVASIISGKAQLDSFAGYQGAITNAGLLLNATNTALDNLGTLISNAKQAGTNALSGTPQSMATYASTVDNLIQSAISVANTEVGGRYLFSGYATDKQAVDTTTGVLNATSTPDLISVQINTGTTVNVNVTAAGLISSAAPLDNTTIIGAMSTLKTAILANDQAGIQTSLAALGTLTTSVRDKQSDIGVRQNRIDLEKQYLTSRDAAVTNSVSDKLMLSEVEIAKLITDAQQKQTSLQSLRSISSGFLNTSLFDFLK